MAARKPHTQIEKRGVSDWNHNVCEAHEKACSWTEPKKATRRMRNIWGPAVVYAISYIEWPAFPVDFV